MSFRDDAKASNLNNWAGKGAQRRAHLSSRIGNGGHASLCLPYK
jgi:hypothetical protein